MGEGQTVVMPGSIGASNPGLAQTILDAEMEIAKIGLELQGYRAVVKPNGALVYEKVNEVDAIAVSPACSAWMQTRLRGALSKTVSLSNIKDQREMDAIAWAMVKAFIFELLSRWDEFELNKNKYLHLSAMYIDYVVFSVRNPLGEGIRSLLSKSTSETYSRSDARVTEQQEKRGIRGILGV